MPLGRRHPDAAAFTRFIDGEASTEEARAVQAHVAGCRRCREDLAFFREVSRTARELAHPTPPPGLLEDVLARREAGERVILPTSPPPPEEENARRPVTVLAGLTLLLAAGGVLFLTSGEATAGASTLRILPEPPRAGLPLTLEFRPASSLAAEERLRVRGWYRTPEAPPPRGTLGAYVEGGLERRSGGRFGGELLLPPSTVYAAFVVEDRTGERVATNQDRLWEMLAHDEAGRPLFAALRQQYRVAEHRESSETLPIARRMTTLYPEDPEGWFYRAVLELALFPAANDSLTRFFRARLARLEREGAGAEALGPRELASLFRLAEALGERDAAARWRSRLLERHPDHRASVELRVAWTIRDHFQDPVALLERLEAEWRRSGIASELLVEQGFRAAIRAARSEAVRAWSERYLRVRPDLGWLVAERMLAFPSLRAEAARICRRELERLATDDPAHRAPERSVPEGREADGRLSRRLLATLGQALVAEGRMEAALDTLYLAAREGWDPELFERLAGLRLAAGDTTGALTLWSYVEADPLEGSAQDRAESALGRGFATDVWAEAVRRAEAEIRARVLSASDGRPINLSVEVLERDGRPRRLGSLVAGRPTLLAYCSQLVLPCRQAIRRLQDHAERASERGVDLLLLMTEEAVPGAGAGAGTKLPTYFDAKGAVWRVLESRHTPQFVVLDGTGRVRFQHDRLDDAVRQALILAREDPSAA